MNVEERGQKGLGFLSMTSTSNKKCWTTLPVCTVIWLSLLAAECAGGMDRPINGIVNGMVNVMTGNTTKPVVGAKIVAK